jgi:hypothetical protein
VGNLKSALPLVTFAEDSANTSADKGIHILGVRTDTLAQSSGTTGDYCEFNFSSSGALYVGGNKAEDAAHTTADYLFPIATKRTDVATPSAGTTEDYATLNTDANGAVYVNNRKTATSVVEANGAAAGGLSIRASAGASTKNRVYNFYLVSDAATTLTLSDGFGTYYCVAGVPLNIDYGFGGKLQTTAATAITVTSSGAANVASRTLYSTEAA